MDEFITIIGNAVAEITEKRSKFIANIFQIENVIEAEEKIKKVKKEYNDARHNCIAYRVIENGKLIEKSSDDGEPSGTAGAPILSILQKNNLCNVLVIVTRYFGGILLGTGGLVSCYSKSTIDAIDKAKKIIKCKGIEAKIELNYSNLENFKYYCKNSKIKIINMEYMDKIVCKIEMDNNKKDKIMQDINSKVLNIENFNILNEKFIEKSI